MVPGEIIAAGGTIELNAGAEVVDDLTGAFATEELHTLAGLLARLNDRADAVLGIGATDRRDAS